MSDAPIKTDWQTHLGAPRCAILLSFVLFFGVGLALSARALSYPWFWDDIHLVRTYSCDELVQVLVSTWDVDGIETMGYRPGTTIFNHVRASVFGENRVAHRLLIIALFAVCLTLFCAVMARVGIPHHYSALASVLALCARYNWFNLLWVADGIHTWVAFLCLLALWSVLAYLDKAAAWKGALCVGLAGLALFTREDAIAFFPLFPVFSLYYIFWAQHPDRFFILSARRLGEQIRDELTHSRLVATVVISILLIVIVMVFLLLRTLFVPGASTKINLTGWLIHIWWTLYPMGKRTAIPGDVWVHEAWTFTLGALALATLVVLSHRERQQAFICLASVVLTAAPGAITHRINLLFFPILFFNLYVVLVLGALAKLSRWMAIFVLAFLCTLVVILAVRHLIAQEAMHPLSLETIQSTYEVISNPNVHIPKVREAKLKAYLATFGIYSEETFKERYAQLVDEALKKNWRRPNMASKPFVPIISFLRP